MKEYQWNENAPGTKILPEKCITTIEFSSPIKKMMNDTLNNKIKYVYLAT